MCNTIIHCHSFLDVNRRGLVGPSGLLVNVRTRGTYLPLRTCTVIMMTSWRRKISTLLVLCEGSPPVTGGFPFGKCHEYGYSLFSFLTVTAVTLPFIGDAMMLIWGHCSVREALNAALFCFDPSFYEILINWCDLKPILFAVALQALSVMDVMAS